MNKLKFYFGLLLIIFATNAWATSFGCASYYLKSSNTLIGVSVFNAKYIGDEHTAELAPTNEIQKGNIIKQYWSLDSYRDEKLFAKCIYKDNNFVIKEIPVSVNLCKLTFVDVGKNQNSITTPGFNCT